MVRDSCFLLPLLGRVYGAGKTWLAWALLQPLYTQGGPVRRVCTTPTSTFKPCSHREDLCFHFATNGLILQSLFAQGGRKTQGRKIGRYASAPAIQGGLPKRPLRMQGRQTKHFAPKMVQTSSPAHTGQTPDCPGVGGSFSFIPCAYRADLLATADRGTRCLHPLRIQGRQTRRNGRGRYPPSSPAHTGQTSSIGWQVSGMAFIPCAYRADRPRSEGLRASCLHPLRIQGRQMRKSLKGKVIPSSPAHTGQTGLGWYVAAIRTFIPCAYRADNWRKRGLLESHLHPLRIQGRP